MFFKEKRYNQALVTWKIFFLRWRDGNYRGLWRNSQKLELFATTAVELSGKLESKWRRQVGSSAVAFSLSFSKQRLLGAPRPWAWAAVCVGGTNEVGRSFSLYVCVCMSVSKWCEPPSYTKVTGLQPPPSYST